MSTYQGSTPVRSENHNSYFQAGYIKCSQYISFSSSAEKSAVLEDSTSLIRVFSTQDCWISVIANSSSMPSVPGAEKVVVQNIKRLRGGIVDFVGIPPGLVSPVVAVISDGVDGVLDIEELR